MYDGYGRNVSIVETVAGSITSTKQFVWSGGNSPEEARNSSGTLTAQYFIDGETISGTSYFYTKDAPPQSIREMTNSAGVIQDQRAYEPYGRVSRISGSIEPDMQFGSYYFHKPSGLSLTRTRSYNSAIARWLSRDPRSEHKGNVFPPERIANAVTPKILMFVSPSNRLVSEGLYALSKNPTLAMRRLYQNCTNYRSSTTTDYVYVHNSPCSGRTQKVPIHWCALQSGQERMPPVC